MPIKTSIELAARCKAVALCHKTLYVLGCWGAPMTENNKKRWMNAQAYNRRWDRKAKINAATSDTFGFDCCGLVKGLLWGWDGNPDKIYGGAGYAINGVPDINEAGIIAACKDVSTDFSKIEVGEIVEMPGHMGVYIGDGLAVEATPAWADKVQITAVANIAKRSGYKSRTWKRHGKLPYIEYPKPVEKKPAFTVLEWQKAAISDGFFFPKYGADGEWGAECESVARKAVCKQRLVYKYKSLTKLVQRAVGVSVDGKYGSQTKKAVKAYQKLHGLTADGEVGINTWRVMLGVK